MYILLWYKWTEWIVMVDTCMWHGSLLQSFKKCVFKWSVTPCCVHLFLKTYLKFHLSQKMNKSEVYRKRTRRPMSTSVVQSKVDSKSLIGQTLRVQDWLNEKTVRGLQVGRILLFIKYWSHKISMLIDFKIPFIINILASIAWIYKW